MASASALGAEGPGFKSRLPDHTKLDDFWVENWGRLSLASAEGKIVVFLYDPKFVAMGKTIE